MRAGGDFALRWTDVMYNEGIIAVRAKFKGGEMRYVPEASRTGVELRRYPAVRCNTANCRISA